MKLIKIVSVLAMLIAPATAVATDFSYCPPGDLLGAGEQGYSGRRVFLSSLVFPVEFQPASNLVTLNSQVYNSGGICHDGDCGSWDNEGSQCATDNYKMPWRDTFCEKAGRGYSNPLCPDGKGHQGLDIRPPTVLAGDKSKQCKANVWSAVAAIDGTVSRVQGAVVTIRGRNRVEFIYRHLDPNSIVVNANQKVRAGDAIARIANFNNAGTKPYTTVHLHIEGRVPTGTGGKVILPLYTSFIAAYRKEIGLSNGIGAGGELDMDGAHELPGC